MIKDPYDLINKKFPQILANDFDESVLSFPQYGLYRNYEQKNPAAEYYCTSCHTWHDYCTKLVHNNFFFCGGCGENIQAKAIGRGRKKLINKRRFVFYTPGDNGRLYARAVEIIQTFEGTDLEPEYYIRNHYVYVFEKTGMQRFRYNDYTGWTAMRTDRCLPSDNYLMSNPGFTEATAIGAERIFETDLKYSEVLSFTDTSHAYDQIKYLCFYIKHNNLEYLVKAGFSDIVKDLIIGEYSPKIINWKQNNLLKMLGITKSEIPYVMAMNCEQLLVYKDVRKEEHCPQKASKIMHFICRKGSIDRILYIRKLTGMSYPKIYAYLGSDRHRLILWYDYLSMANKLPGGIGEITPKNLQAAHDRVLNEKQFIEEKESAEKIIKRSVELTPLLFESKDFIMRAPQSGHEIIYEGQALCHCVGGYVKRHAEGKTNILFIRKREYPDIPYFTIEVASDLYINQCHGYRNDIGGKPEEIKMFEEEYTKYLEELKHERERVKLKPA